MQTNAPTTFDDDTGERSRLPERRCLVLGDSAPRDRLIRFALAPDGTVTPDLAEKLPGRGAYVTADPAALAQAVAKKAFTRAFKRQVTVPADLTGMIAGLLRTRLLDQLGLAKKAGMLGLGEEAVTLALKQPKARNYKLGAVLLASDASPRTADDYRQKAASARVPFADLPASASAIGAALGRDNTVYLCVAAGKMAETLLRDCARLAPFVTKTSDESRT